MKALFLITVSHLLISVVEGHDGCNNAGNIFIQGETLSLSTILKSTNNFKCKGKAAEYVTICASNVLKLDTKFRRDAVSRRFLQIIIVATKVVVGENIPGCTPDQCTVFDLNGEDGWTYKFNLDGSWSTGGDGGNFLGIALEWVNVRGLQILASPGRPGCAGAPQFNVLKEQLVVKGEKLLAIKPKGPIFRGTTKNTGVANVITYDVFDMIRVVDGLDGKAGTVLLLGDGAKQIFSLTDAPRRLVKCKPVSANELGNFGGGMNIFERITTAEYFAQAARVNPVQPPATPIDQRAAFLQEVRTTLIKMVNDKRLTSTKAGDLVKFIHSVYFTLKFDSEESFVNELIYVFENSLTIENNLEDTIIQDVQRRIRNFTGNNAHLIWLYTAAEGHRSRILREDDLITDLEAYTSTLQQVVTKNAGISYQTELVSKAAQKYETETNLQIQEAIGLTQTTLFPQLNIISGNIDKTFTSVKDQLLKSIDTARKDEQRLRKDLQNAITLRCVNTVLNIFSMIGGAISFFPPPLGPIIGVSIQITASIGKTIAKPSLLTTALPNGYQFPESLKRTIRPVVNFIERKRYVLIKNLEDILAAFQPYPDVLKEFKQMFAAVKALQKEPSSRKKLAGIQEIDTKMRKRIRVLSQKNIEATTRDGSTDDNSTVSIFRNTTAALTIGKSLADGALAGARDFLNDTSEIERIRLQISQIQMETKQLMSFVQKLQDQILPMVVDMMEAISAVNQDLAGQRLGAIDISTWNMLANIKDVKHELVNALASFNIIDDLNRSFDKIEAVITTIGVVHSRVAASKEKNEFATLVLGLTNPQTLIPPVDPLQKKLERVLRESLMSGIVERVTYAFRMWAFPFSKVFLKDTTELVPSGMNVPLDTMIGKCVNQLNLIKSSISTYKNSINPVIDKYRKNTGFYPEYGKGSDAFFIWDWETYQSSIRQLISNNTPVFFNADIQHYQDNGRHFDKEVIQFATISLKFIIRNNPAAQERYKRALKEYKLEMIQMGLNYYAFQNKIYLFKTPVLKVGLLASNIDNDYQQFTSATLSTTKYSIGDGVMSPYGQWTFRLTGRSIREKISFTALALKSGEKLDIHLIGTGTTLQPFTGGAYRDSTVDKYFEAVGVIANPSKRASAGSGINTYALPTCPPKSFRTTHDQGSEAVLVK